MSALDYLVNYRIVRIHLPVREGQPLVREAVAQVTSAPFFEVTFLPGQLPALLLDREGKCRVIFEADGRPFGITASIDAVRGAENRLRLQALEAGGFAHKREYFRVDTELTVRYRRLQDGPEAPFSDYRGKVNLSGGGIWFVVDAPVAPKEKLDLELHFDKGSGASLRMVGEVVRVADVPRGRWGVGLHFVEIDPADRDRLLSFCLVEQRKLLQTRVRILDQE